MTTGWEIDPKCHWCGASFTTDTIDTLRVFVCPTETCRARQLAWRLDDDHGQLFHLPLPKQVELEEAVASQRYGAICIGGSRAGGKSTGWRRICYRYCLKIPEFSVLFLRRTFPELVSNHVEKAVREAKRLNAKVSAYKMTFAATDALITFGHCQDPKDYAKYIGPEYDLIVFDQLESFTETQFAEISAATSRVSRDDWRGLVGAGENPNGPLSAFVTDLFVKKKVDQLKYPDYDPEDYFFIHSSLEDNPNVDPRYIKRLAGLSPEKRAMYRFGNRDVFPGQVFHEWDPNQHVRSIA